MKRRDINAADAPPPAGQYTQAVEVTGASRTLYLSGQVGVAADGSIPTDADAQSALAWRNLQSQLRAAGMEIENLVKITTIVRDPADIARCGLAAKAVLGTHRPASTLIVGGLGQPGLEGRGRGHRSRLIALSLTTERRAGDRAHAGTCLTGRAEFVTEVSCQKRRRPLTVGCAHEADNPGLRRPARDRATGGIVRAVQDMVIGHGAPFALDQRLVASAVQPRVDCPAVGDRTAQRISPWLAQTIEPRRERRIGTRRCRRLRPVQRGRSIRSAQQ